jgi:hypothetical protein
VVVQSVHVAPETNTAPKPIYSCDNNMHPGPVPQELLVSIPLCYLFATSYLLSANFLQGLEEMLISAVMPLYPLPQGQYGYTGHVVNLPQDVASFTQILPRLPSDLDVIVVTREGAERTRPTVTLECDDQ